MPVDPSVLAIARADEEVKRLAGLVALNPGDPKMVIPHGLAEIDRQSKIIEAWQQHGVLWADIAEHGLHIPEEEARRLYGPPID